MITKTKAIIIKSSPGLIEDYDEHKLGASIYAVCLSVRTPAGEAELTASKVCNDIQSWLDTKSEITSRDVRQHAAEHLKLYNPDAAYMYLRPFSIMW